MKVNRLKLFLNMIVKFGVGFLLIGFLLFFCAGTIAYTGGWAFILSLAAPMVVFGLYLFIKDPETLERRLKSKEPDKSQRVNIVVSGIMFIALFVLAGLDFRFGWSKAPFAVTVIALVIMLFGYGLFVAVIMQNTYASRVVEVTDSQKIITSGLYSVVRHPMYTATILIYLAMPFVLGSYFAFIPMILYPVIIVRRIKNEEDLLIEQLDGYKEYVKKVRYRLLPFIW